MLEVKNVTKKYGKLTANDDISFFVKPGQIAVLLGPNGAGKSTLIKCIAGLLRFKGEIALDSYNNKSLEAKAIMGYVPEMPAMYELLTVDEHLEFICRAYNVDNLAYGQELLEIFELADKKKKLAKELSKGMQQKLSICCALVHKPKVLIMDEPLVGLDPHAIKQLKQLLINLRNDNCCILISTHMIDSVEGYWDVAHIIDKGKFAATKVRQDDTDEEGLEELFFRITETKNDGVDNNSQQESEDIEQGDNT